MATVAKSIAAIIRIERNSFSWTLALGGAVTKVPFIVKLLARTQFRDLALPRLLPHECGNNGRPKAKSVGLSLSWYRTLPFCRQSSVDIPGYHKLKS